MCYNIDFISDGSNMKNYKATKSKAGPPLKTLLDPCMDQCAEILA